MGQAVLDPLDALMTAHGASAPRVSTPTEVTTLAPADEQKFRQWVATNKITDLDHPDSHYDYRGYWQESKGAAHKQGDHFPDTYKQHGHPTFSVESKYSSGPTDGGHWNGDTFVPSTTGADPLDALMQQHGADQPADYHVDVKATDGAAHHRSILERIGDAAADFGHGAVAGAASTVFHGGDLIRRGLGMTRVINTPEVQAAITEPNSLAGKAGKLVEQGAEFALPLGEVSKATAGASFVRRVAADAAGSAAVAGVQTGGDPTSMAGAAVLGAAVPVAGAAGRTVTRAAAGAREGGVGGALANAVRTVAPGEPRQMMVQALKPRASSTGFERALDRALPELKVSEEALGKPITTIDELLEATKTAKQRVRAQYDEIAGPKRAIGSTVDLNAVADAMEQSIPSKVKLEDPRKAAALLDRADKYRTSFPLEDAETLLKETNAELESFYNKNPTVQRKALASDPEVAALEAQARTLRDAIYKTLDAPGQGAAARELQRRYGSLMEVEETATRRANVAKRQQPESLSEQIGTVRAAGDLARGVWKATHGDLTGLADVAAARAGRSTAKYLKEQQTTDALIRRALAGVTATPKPIVMPPVRQPIALLERGSLITPPPADPSFVRGVPAAVAVPERLALPAGRPPITTPPPADVSGGELLDAKRTVVRDPKTGRMKRVYTTESQ